MVPGRSSPLFVFPLRQPPATETPLLTHEDIIVRERVATRRRQLRWTLGTIGTLALALAIGFSVRPALHAVKSWQARRLAGQARQLMDEEKWLDARTKVGDAYAIWQNEPEAVRVTGLFLNRVGNPRQALTFWNRLETLTTLTADDHRDFASAELAAGNLDAATAQLHRVWPTGSVGTRADWPLGMQLALRRDDAAGAAALARRIVADPAISAHTRLGAASVLLYTDRSAEGQALAWRVIQTLAAEGKSPVSLDALVAMARRPDVPPANHAPPDAWPTFDALLARIEAHPLAKIQHHLLATDLRIAHEPGRKAALIQAAISRFGTTWNDAELAALTGWLYGKGEFDRSLTLLPADRAAGDRTLFLQRLDLLGALGRWADIREAIQARKFPLEPMLAQMYLARCADQLGQPDVRDAAWEAALDAAGTDSGKLLQVGQYAEKNGALPTAGKAFRAAVADAPDLREANEGYFHLLEATGRTRELRDALITYAKHAPTDRSLRNDIAFFDALLETDVPAARDIARQLVREMPASLPHRVTLALAELRLGNGLAALDAFKGITLPDLSTLPARPRAVYAAVLWKTSYEREAREVARSIGSGQLLPEEHELIRPILESPAS